MERVSGVLEVGCNEAREVVINHPDLKPDVDGVGHIVFSPKQAWALGLLLRTKAVECLLDGSHPWGEDEMELTFEGFQFLNRERCVLRFEHSKDWKPADWGLAIAGEAGELCNLLKKVNRGDFTVEDKRVEILSEIADVITYCDALMSNLGASTGAELMRKFDEVSKRVGYNRR